MKTYLLFLFSTINLITSAQIEVPTSEGFCNQFTKNNFTYCLDSNYNPVWTALQIKGSHVENKVYFPADKEFFKQIPEEIAYVLEKTEIQVKLWAMHFDSVYVVTGRKEITAGSLNSTAYYKAILKGCQGDALAFWVAKKKSTSNITDYALTIDELEQKTGMNFFPMLNKDLQNIVEEEFNWEFWPVSVD